MQATSLWNARRGNRDLNAAIVSFGPLYNPGMDPDPGISIQLREAAQLAGAAWAAVAERLGGVWNLRAVYHLSRSAQSNLSEMLGRPAVDAWLCGALSGGHSRSGSLPEDTHLEAERFFAFPVRGSSTAILVGAAQQDSEAQRVWKLTASLLSRAEAEAKPSLPDLRAGVAEDLPAALDRVLALFVQAIGPQGAWLCIIHGDLLEIRAEWNDPSSRALSIDVDAYPVLRRMRRTRAEVSVAPDDPAWAQLPGEGGRAGLRVWACLPLTIGQRLIGAVMFWRAKDLSDEEWSKAKDLALQAAPIVDVNVTFAEMADHLQRLALLKDFVLTVSSASNVDELTRRAFALLARVFDTELLALYLPGDDRRPLREYRPGALTPGAAAGAGAHEWIRAAMKQGRPQRIGDAARQKHVPLHAHARSALLVPLRHRGQGVGVVIIEHSKPEAFTQLDEHLMVVIAGHLASLIEYGRLREEAEGRARNLGLIHEVVQEIIGLSSKADVAQITADLLAQYFRYELTAVHLTNGQTGNWIRGFGGVRGAEVKKLLSGGGPSGAQGITSLVLSSGKSMLLNDTSIEPEFVPLDGWNARSEMCVAMRTGERILGVIDIESEAPGAFSQNDLVAIESLAGVLAAVISSVDHHENLETTVGQLRLTEVELKNRMEALQTAERRLVQAAKLAAVGEMAAGIAHELNNPLTTVTGFSELLLDGMPAEAPNRADLELVLKEARRAGEVVRQLLDFARQGDRIRAHADFNQIVQDVIALTSHLIRTSGVALSLQLGRGLPEVLVDRNQLQQVILNLIHNSLQAMPAGGDLEIGTRSAARDGHSWLLCWVRDTGMGIPPQARERIFEPFFTTRSDRGGTGLGLSVSYGIVTDHGGTIQVESEIGRGTTFSVWLPT